MKERKLRVLWVDDIRRGRVMQTYLEITREGEVNLSLVDSIEGAISELSKLFDVLVCHISYDQGKIGSYAKRKDNDILTIGISGGGLSDYMTKPMGYDVFVGSTASASSFDGVENVLVERGLLSARIKT
ncbi:hypothetical protein J4443_05200 [Candidatus Woesearchaeota archaeon]|nr:hypothetical protein [Candidatus Woesearchaeota archaeon]